MLSYHLCVRKSSADNSIDIAIISNGKKCKEMQIWISAAETIKYFFFLYKKR